MHPNILQAVASVENAISSIFSKEDVINLLNSIEIDPPAENEGLTSGVTLTKKQIEELCEKICDQIKDNADNLSTSDVVDLGSAEFSVSGNYIELDSVDIDTSNITDTVVDGIGDVIEEFFEELNGDDNDGE